MSSGHVSSALAMAIAEVSGVQGVYYIDRDGFLLDSIDPGRRDSEAVAASAATLHLTSERAGAMLGLGDLRWILFEFKNGKVILFRHESVIWVVVTTAKVMLGDIFMKLKTGQ